MLEYVQYTAPDAESLREQINKVKGERSMATFADDIKRSSPNVRVSAPTISRACNWNGGKPVSIELLEAIALIADKESGVTIETLVAANGMRSKEEDSRLSKKNTVALHRETLIEVIKSVIMIIQNEITSRGYSMRKLSGSNRNTLLHAPTFQNEMLFPRNYNFGFSVSGMSPCSTWKFALNTMRFTNERDENDTEANVRHFIDRTASVFAGDLIESELYENEKYSFVFVEKKLYYAFIRKLNDHGMMVNGLITVILIDLENNRVIDETQLIRNDGAEARSLFKESILDGDEEIQYQDLTSMEKEGEFFDE